MKLQSLLENTDQANDEFKDGFFLLGYWDNPYRAEKEYFWSGPFEDRKDAVAFNKRKQERGQPKQFIDWVKGSGKVIVGLDKFVLAAEKAGLKKDEYHVLRPGKGRPSFWSFITDNNEEDDLNSISKSDLKAAIKGQLAGQSVEQALKSVFKLSCFAI